MKQKRQYVVVYESQFLAIICAPSKIYAELIWIRYLNENQYLDISISYCKFLSITEARKLCIRSVDSITLKLGKD